jgi:hypothetical protein
VRVAWRAAASTASFASITAQGGICQSLQSGPGAESPARGLTGT